MTGSKITAFDTVSNIFAVVAAIVAVFVFFACTHSSVDMQGTIVSSGAEGIMVEYEDEYGELNKRAISNKKVFLEDYAIGDVVTVHCSKFLFLKEYSIAGDSAIEEGG